MNVSVINEGENVFPYIFKKLVFENNDFSENIVIFPGKRPTFFLINEIKKRINKPFIPPKLYSMNDFIDYCYEKELSIKDKKVDVFSACKIIIDILQEKGNPTGLNNLLPLALKLYNAFEELFIEGIDSKRLDEFSYRVDDLISKYFKGISDLYEKFYKLLSERNLSTRSMRYKKVSENDTTIILEGYKNIIFCGFFALSQCEKDLFKKFANDERVCFIFQGECAKKYAFNNVYEQTVIDSKKIELFECPDTHSEIFKLIDELERDIKNSENKESFLIINPSSDTLIPIVSNLDKELSDYNVSLGYPLIRTPLYSFLKHLFDALITKEDNKYYISDYLKFALHPYTKNIKLKGNAEITRIIFHSIDSKLSENRFRKYIELEELESEDFLKDALKDVIKNDTFSLNDIKSHLKMIHENTLLIMDHFENISDFAEKLVHLVNFIYEKSTASLHILFTPYCEAMLKALFELKNSLISTVSFNQTYEYFDFFKKFISLYRVPFEGTPVKDIQILGFLESRNLKFDNVYILDANEGILPDNDREDTILPYDVRRYLGLPTYREKDTIYDYYLRNIIAGSKRTKIFFVNNENSEKSRFVERIIWEKQLIDKSIKKGYVRPVCYNFTLEPYLPKPVEKRTEVIEFLKTFTFSATSLDTYYVCPLRFYYQYVLLPRQNEGIVEDLKGKDVGSIIHSILKCYFVDKNTAFNLEKFDKVVEDVFEEYFGKEIKGVVLLVKHQVKKQLKNFMEHYEEIAGGKVKILELEKEFTKDIEIKNIGMVKLKGIIDRLEKRKDGIYVIDYKTGTNLTNFRINWKNFIFDDRNTWEKAFKTIQLIFYVYLVKDLYHDCNASFIFLTAKYIDKCEIKLFECEEKGNSIYVEGIVRNLIEDIFFHPNFEPTRNTKECKYCNFRLFCYKKAN
jgi:ATP-dependent helicase/nuclease subunit B